jgi:tRNA nucleotidyltransferase (CCA-adding enzyme)
VVKVSLASGWTVDFTIPRRDSKVGPGHKGFVVNLEPGITLEEAAARRDFTINSVMYDPRQDRVLDPFQGQADLRNGILRHTSPAFTEDPLRVLRGMQLAARFGLRPAPETTVLCRQIKGAYKELAVERVREEWFKWAAKSSVPSAGLRFLETTEWIEHFPEINGLRGTPQDPEWHPEGDVFVHTCYCCDALVRLEEWKQSDEESRIVYSLATLAHDFGKPPTTERVMREGRNRIVSPRHDEVGVGIAKLFLARIDAPRAIVDRVLPLVANHMAHLQTVTDRAVRRLAKRLEPENIQGLCVLMTADSMGRPPLPARVPPVVAALCAKAAELKVHESAPKPILQGRHLLELGFAPGPAMGEILYAAFEAQIEGKFFDLAQAHQWLTENGYTANR